MAKNDTNTDPAATPAPESKQFSLKPIETQMVQSILQMQNTHLSNFLSFISLERFAHQVTPNTKFDLNEDLTAVTITELPPVEQPDQPGDKPETGVVS
jgi:hypothetical protein